MLIQKTVYAGILSLFALLLSGCPLLLVDDYDDYGSYSYCDQSGCYICDDWGCYRDGSGGGVRPGDACSNNVDCAEGCYCAGLTSTSDGVCEEGGFCTRDRDCADGFSCDSRSSCVPNSVPGTPNGQSCSADADCDFGSYCDEPTGQCIDSFGCNKDEQCGMGFDCDTTRNTCVPEFCETDDDCQSGCYCNEEQNECVETSTCDDGCAEGLTCDAERNTCEPDGPITCQAEVTCDEEAPECAADTTPAIQNGCYTGECLADASCPDGAPFECSDLNADEAGCVANASCSPVYRGSNCTDPAGAVCTSGSANCVCESFSFDFCEAPSPAVN